MSKQAVEWATNQKIADRTLVAVLRAVAFLADRGTFECCSSQARIAREVGVTDRCVRASLTVLERLEIISRRARSKGKYGRTTDAVTINADRSFDVSRAAVQAIRLTLQLEYGSGSKNGSNRNAVPLQPERRSGEYNTVNTEEALSGGRLLAHTVTVEDITSPYSDRVVIPFRRGGVA